MLEKATVEDIPAIESMVNAAYSKYIERIGKLPAPMTEDWDQAVRTREILVLRDNERTVGSITIHEDEQTTSLKIDNVVVNPGEQGRGYGYHMIKYAEVEALNKGLSSVTLFTNVKMFENIGFYAKLGFVETDRRMEDGFERVYFYKNLSEDFLRLLKFISILVEGLRLRSTIPISGALDKYMLNTFFCENLRGNSSSRNQVMGLQIRKH